MATPEPLSLESGHMIIYDKHNEGIHVRAYICRKYSMCAHITQTDYGTLLKAQRLARRTHVQTQSLATSIHAAYTAGVIKTVQ